MKTYTEFKTEIHRFYPGSSNNVFTIHHHLDVLIGEHTWLGIHNTPELGDFHLQFRTIPKYLIDKHRMLQAKQTQGFLHVVQPELENQVKQRLQIMDPQHDPQDPYELGKVYEVAAYCLLSSAPAGSMSAMRSATLLAPLLPPVNIKAELQTEVQSVIKSASCCRNDRDVQECLCSPGTVYRCSTSKPITSVCADHSATTTGPG
jgi:hypothetical protein